MKENMLKSFAFLVLLTACGVSLWAQSAGATPDSSATVTHVVRPLYETGIVVEDNTPEVASTPFIVNVTTVIGVNSTGLPCFDCVMGAASPNIGILEPSGVIKRGGAPSQMNAFLFDQNYTGPCNYTIEIVDKNKTVVASVPSTFSETANTSILLGTAVGIPSTAAVGMGHVQTIAKCGTSTTKSATAVFISK